MITVGQIKAARALLNLKQRELANKAGISVATLNNIERGAQTDPRISTMCYIRQALEKEGIVFVNDSLEGTGVQLKPRRSANDCKTILIVDDARSDRKLFSSWLHATRGKYHVVEADTARAGLDAFAQHRPQCIILDFMLHGTDGFQLLGALKKNHESLPPVIFVSGMHNTLLHETAQYHGVFRCLDKRQLTQASLSTHISQALSQ